MKRIFFLLFILLPFLSKSQVNITGYIAPFGLGQYPTHADSLGYSGYRVAKDITERDAITCLRRKFGMAVYVQNIGKIYILKDSACNNVWEEFTTSNAAIDSIRRKVASDSVFGYINGVAIFQFKDSSGGAGTVTKAVDSVYKVNNGDTIFVRYNNNTVISTLKIKDSIGITDTANKYVNAISKNTTKDSIVFFIGGNRYAIKDSSSSITGSGTVTSISQGYGISNSPNTITTTGTISVDSSTLSNKYVRISDTLQMLSKYLEIYDTLNMLSGYVRKSRTISTTSPLTGGGSLNGDLTLQMPQSGNASNGWLSSTDWLTFFNKANNTISINATLGSGPNLSGGGNLTTSRTIVIPKATTSVDGYLSATDYLTFAGKQGTLTPISPIEISGSLLSIRKAGLSDSGYLSSIDWNTFNNKLSTSDTTNKFVNNVIKLNDSTISVFKGTGFTNIILNSGKIDSLKRSNDSIFARKNGTFIFQYKDTLGDDTATVVVAQVYNAEATTLNRGEVVYLFGANGDRASVKRANNLGDSSSSKTFGFVRENILAGGIGYIVTQGQIGKLNLSSYTAGQTIYLDSVAGQFTSVKPVAPKHLVVLGVIERANAGNGIIYAKPVNGFELDELHNVFVNGTLNNSLLYYDSTNKLWKANKLSFAKNAAKDSIILNYGSLRLAVKDSISGGGGAAGPDNSIQFKNVEGNMSGSSNLTWLNSAQYLGIGLDNPYTTLDVRKGVLDDLPRNYEIANFTKDGEVKLGVYNSSNYDGTGSAITLGNTKNPNANAGYPAFEFQNINDSANSTGFVRFNYFERDGTGDISLASTDLLTINSDGTVQINPTNYGLGAAPRLVIGGDESGEAQLDVSGSSYLYGKLTTAGARNKHIVYVTDDVDGATYNVTSSDHIIIYRTIDGNCTINLPASPENGRELTIKQIGDYTSFTLTVDAGSGKEISDVGGQSGNISSTINSQSVTLVYYDGVWYLTAGQLE